MAEITVPPDERPSFAKYVVFTGVGIFVIGALAGQMARGADSVGFALLILVAAGIGNLSILFLMIQSLIEEWIAAAEIVD